MKIKTFWPLSMFFKPKEYDVDTKEILRRKFGDEKEPEKELVGSEKQLAEFLKAEALVSQIAMTRIAKFGGCGICCYCGKRVSNKAFHEARCPQRHETARSLRAKIKSKERDMTA